MEDGPRNARAVASSAGKNASTASSDSVMSIGVPNTVVVPKRQDTARRAQFERHDDAGVVARRTRAVLGFVLHRVRPELVQEIGQDLIVGTLDLPLQPFEQMTAPFDEFTMRGASPLGCRLTRRTFTGGVNSD